MIDLIDGYGEIWSNDGTTYLGLVISNCYALDSIVNDYGNYGSSYSSTSIRNPYGLYGSAYSNTSAFNANATEPPVIWIPNGTTYTAYAYATINTYQTPRIDSAYLVAYLQTKGGCGGWTQENTHRGSHTKAVYTLDGIYTSRDP